MSSVVEMEEPQSHDGGSHPLGMTTGFSAAKCQSTEGGQISLCALVQLSKLSGKRHMADQRNEASVGNCYILLEQP